MQSRSEALIEAVINTFIAFWISFAVGAVMYPLFGFKVTPAQNALIVVVFSVISILRNYVIRRFFNARLKKAAQSIASLT